MTTSATSSQTIRPETNEFAEYYGKYVKLVPDANILNTLKEQHAKTTEFISALSEEQGTLRYAEGKWSIKEMIGHLIDSERIFAYRALRFARNDKVELPGFDQNGYVENGDFDNRSLADLAREYSHVRAATLDLFEHLNEEAWSRRGTANENEITVRAIAWIIGGHEIHHIDGIKSNYLK